MNNINQDFIFNRRYDDIIMILNHEIKFLEKDNDKYSLVNKLYVDYLNNFGEKFFNLNLNINEKINFHTLINRKMSAILNEFIDDNEIEILNNIKNLNTLYNNFILIDFFRKINNFSMRDKFGDDKIVSIKILPLQNTKYRNIINNYYYLLIKPIEIEVELSKFRIKYFQNMNMINKNDPYFDISDLQSSINEIKMFFAFKRKFINIDITLASLEINEYINDHILMQTCVKAILPKIRVDDFIGMIDNNKIIICLFNCDYNNSGKILKRLINIIKSKSYVTEKYKNNINDIFYFRCFDIKANDDPNQTINYILKNYDSIVINKDTKYDII